MSSSQIILIAENGVDMFDKNVQLENVFPKEESVQYNAPVTELPELPSAQPTQFTEYVPQTQQNPVKKEAGVIAEKAFISFGTMLICIALFIVIALFFKKKQTQNQQDIYTYKEPEKVQNDEPEYIQSPVRKIKTSKLNTPTSIHQCILSFLEITKEN